MKTKRTVAKIQLSQDRHWLTIWLPETDGLYACTYTIRVDSITCIYYSGNNHMAIYGTAHEGVLFESERIAEDLAVQIFDVLGLS